MEEYYLIQWPESQDFMSEDLINQCHMCIDIAGALFVPKKIYHEITDR